jgi:hypothetical protein
MTISVPGAVLLAWQVAAARDTVLVRPLPPIRSGMEQFFFVTSGLTSVLALALLTTLIIMLIWARRAALAAGERMDALLEELLPVLEQARGVGDSVRKTAEMIEQDVATVTEGVQETSARVKKSVGELANRVDDFNQLLGKVHARADTVVDVAGTAMDGLAWGVKKLRGRRAPKLRKK